ncbi:11757_t:CDS:2 [Ambispora gerdemannii]|uniref:11757_t:CDS:1 n=1 Tax=Ambispora gerdemannii TaxID=144530 RepID=A0A9N8YMW8_9GLOM|nr:11757_t:CDS:2 [Ambispora gerdemannii]
MATEVESTTEPTKLEESSMTTTNTPTLTPPENYTPILPAPLNDKQKAILTELETYVESILLPEDDAYYSHERAWVTEACLKRYLRASKWHINDAKQRIKYTLEWRRDYKPDQIDMEEMIEENLTGKMYLHGFDKYGRPILVLRPGYENTKAGPSQVRNVVFWFEKAITLMPENVETITILVDFNKTSARTSPGLGIAKEFMHVLGSHYPERLGLACVINGPWYFWTFFKLIGNFIDPVTKEKIQFVNLLEPEKVANKKQWVNLDTFIDVPQLEIDYGGKSHFVYEHKVYWDVLSKMKL